MAHFCYRLTHDQIDEFRLKDDGGSDGCHYLLVPASEESSLIPVFRSILISSRHASCPWTVLFLVNEPEQSGQSIRELNKGSFDELALQIGELDPGRIHIHLVYVRDIPEKMAGVGYARKMAMDLCVQELAGKNQ